MKNQLQIKKKNGGYTITAIDGYAEKIIASLVDNEKDALQFARLYDANNMSKEYTIVVI